jgi:Integral membrane protein CcmA involved in cell shape determination
MDTLIGGQTEILGDVRFSGGLHVDGRIKGNVVAAGEQAATLSVSEGGTIEGDVHVATVVLNGTIHGDLHAGERLTLAAKARVVGNVHYRVLQMEAGAMVNGALVYEGAEKLAALTHHRDESSTSAAAD